MEAIGQHEDVDAEAAMIFQHRGESAGKALIQ